MTKKDILEMWKEDLITVDALSNCVCVGYDSPEHITEEDFTSLTKLDRNNYYGYENYTCSQIMKEFFIKHN